MDERITSFTEVLRRTLAGLPEEEVAEAVGFYEEYLNDAIEAGKDPGTIINELDPLEKIAGMIRTEISITKARNNPGIKNFNSVFKSAFGVVKRPLNVFWMSIAALISYSMVAALFGGALASALSAGVIGLGMAYEAARIPLKFFPSIFGAIGAGLLAGGLCMLVAISLYKLGMLFIKLSARLIGAMLNIKDKPARHEDAFDVKVPAARKRLVPALVLLMLAGAVLFGVSGLPATYFSIFNSMPPAASKTITEEYNPALIQRITVKSAQSRVSVETSDESRIVIAYNEPVWMDYKADSTGGMLAFTEVSSGMLPLFPLVTLHEGMGSITVLIPKDYDPAAIDIESTGGHLSVKGVAANIRAKTQNGNIAFMRGPGYQGGIFAKTGKGSVEVDGSPAGQRAGEGAEYKMEGTSGRIAELETWGGSITID